MTDLATLMQDKYDKKKAEETMEEIESFNEESDIWWRKKKHELVEKLVDNEKRPSNFSFNTKKKEMLDADFLCRACRKNIRHRPFCFYHRNLDGGDKTIENCRLLCFQCWRLINAQRLKIP